MFGGLGLLIATAVIVIASIVKFRQAERRAIARVFAMAADRGIPLSNVARELGNEMPPRRGMRLLQLAEDLDQGAYLPSALAVAPKVLSHDELLAVDFGCENDTLAQSLTETATRSDSVGQQLRAMLEKLFYLTLIISVASSIVTFLMIKIVPTFAELFEGFDMELPPPTLLLIEFSAAIAPAAGILFILFLGLFAIGAGFYMGVIPRSFPVVRRWSIRIDGAHIKRMLAIAVRQQRSIVGTIRWLAERHPLANVRAKLGKTISQIEQGVHWCDCLHVVRLMTRADVSVLKSAETVGNLPWALDEMADSTVRRMTYRVTAATNVLFPLCLAGIGVGVLFITTSLFVPLIDLINAMSG